MSRPAPRPASTRRQRGHTLWEMLLVLAVMATIGAIVAPAVVAPASSNRTDVARTAQGLVDLLARARSTAMDRGTSVRVVLDPNMAHVWTFALDRGELRLVGDDRLAQSASVELVANGPRVRFTFDASGTASGEPLMVRGTSGTRRIVIDPWSGAAHADSL